MKRRKRPMRTALRVGRFLFTTAFVIVSSSSRAQQDLGHKTLGTIGLRAGRQVDTGIYLTSGIGCYEATKLLDRHGVAIPVGLDLQAAFGQLGVGVAYQLPKVPAFVNAAIAVPMARASLQTARPEASIDRFGLGDVYVKPLGLGWRTERLQLVAAYAFYAPTGAFEPGGNDGIGRGHWTHQFSLGGTIIFDAAQKWRLSALASYDLNLRKRNIDITRGATVQIEGGFGYTVRRILDVGVAAYGLWQVTDDTGADVPPVLLGARDTAYGIGPELDLTLPHFRGILTARYEHDFAVRARPQGEIFWITWTARVWAPPVIK